MEAANQNVEFITVFEIFVRLFCFVFFFFSFFFLNALQSDNGRLYSRGRFICQDELGQTFVIRRTQDTSV